MSAILETGICSIIEIIGYILCYTLIFKMKIVNKKLLIPYCLVVFGGLYLFRNIPIFSNVSLLGGFLFIFCGSIKKIGKNIISFVYIAFIESLFYVLTAFAVSIVVGHDVTRNKGSGILILCVCSFPIAVLLFYLICKIVCKDIPHILFYRAQKIAFLIAIICSVSIVTINLKFFRDDFSKKNLIISGCFFAITSIICLSSMLFGGIASWKNERLREEQMQYDIITETQTQYLDYIIKRDEDLRRFRHDFRAHMIIMRDMITNGNTDELLEYIDKIGDIIGKSKAQKYTGNSTIDAIVNNLMIKIGEAKIDFQITGQMMSEVDTKTFDIGVCVYNILLNAVEACEKLEVDERIIKFDIEQFQKKLYFKICNRCNEQDMPQTTSLKTSKNDELNHGIGSRNVQEIVSRNNGKVVYSIESGWFITEVLI